MLDTPVVLITYKRPETTRRVLERIARARPRVLYVASDGPRSAGEEPAVLATRRLFDRLDWDCELHRDFADQNLGLALRLTSAVTNAFDRFDELIVLEDDTLPDPTFFGFCGELLERYRSDERVLQVKGTCPIPNAHRVSPYSYLFTQQAGPWGWASWKRAWERFDWSFFETERAHRHRARPRARFGHWLRGWRKVRRNPALRERVRRCGHYYRIWMRACDTRAISSSWAGVFAFGVVEHDGLVASPLRNLVSNIGFGADSIHFRNPRHAVAGADLQPLQLPLRHPPVVAVDRDFERRCARAVDRAFFGRRKLDDTIEAARRRWRATAETPSVPRRAHAAGAPGEEARSDLSIVIGWNNVKRSELERACRMFETLAAQLRELPGRRLVELVIGFDADAFDLATVRASVDGMLAPLEPTWPVRFVSDTDVDYYQIKNLGGREASGDLLLFLDGDAVPEAGWLRAILEPFSDPAIQVVSGHTDIEPHGILAKTIALAWFFPLRTVPEDAGAGADFLASNVAFRRTLFERYPFPQESGTSRGACRNLVELLDREGVVGRRNPAARVMHPPPAGLVHCLVRGLVQGRDFLRQRRDDAYHVFTWRPFVDAWTLVAGQGLRGIRDLVVDRERVGLSWPGVPVAVAIWSAFTIARLAGVGLERLRPGRIGRHLSI